MRGRGNSLRRLVKQTRAQSRWETIYVPWQKIQGSTVGNCAQLCCAHGDTNASSRTLFFPDRTAPRRRIPVRATLCRGTFSPLRFPWREQRASNERTARKSFREIAEKTTPTTKSRFGSIANAFQRKRLRHRGRLRLCLYICPAHGTVLVGEEMAHARAAG